MPLIELSSNEAEMLQMILENCLSDLRMEISHTDSMDFREHLKERKVLLEKVLQALEAPAKS